MFTVFQMVEEGQRDQDQDSARSKGEGVL